MRTNFFSISFLNTPRSQGYPGKIPGTSQIFEGEHELFGHPSGGRPPLHRPVSGAKKLIFVLFCLAWLRCTGLNQGVCCLRLFFQDPWSPPSNKININLMIRTAAYPKPSGGECQQKLSSPQGPEECCQKCRNRCSSSPKKAHKHKEMGPQNWTLDPTPRPP